MRIINATFLAAAAIGCSPSIENKPDIVATVDESGRIHVDGERRTDIENAMTTPRPEPRTHHFQFAKLWLPQLALSNPEKFIDTFSQPSGKDYLTALWNGIGTKLPQEDRIPADTLSLDSEISNGYQVITVVFPQPEAPNECFFVAAVVESGTPSSLRLFGIEMADASEAHPNGTALVEWDRKGRYTYQESPEPHQEQFVTRICAIVSTSEEALTFTDLRPMGWFAQPSNP